MDGLLSRDRRRLALNAQASWDRVEKERRGSHRLPSFAIVQLQPDRRGPFLRVVERS